jgi:sulfatase maturation enzyme AslB (radical SAM superfamily)
MQMVLTPDCFDQILPLSKLAIDLGVDYLQIKQFSDPGDERLHRFDYEKYQYPSVNGELKEAEAMSTDRTNIIIKWGMINDQEGDNRKFEHCNSLPFLFQISGNSKCYPCGYLFNHERYCYGDLKRKSFEEIITSNRYWEIIEHMATDFNVHGACMGNCRHRFILEFLHNYLNVPPHVNFI